MNYLTIYLSRTLVKVPNSPFPVADIQEVLLQTPSISAENPKAALLEAKSRFPYLGTNLAVQDADSYNPSSRRDAPRANPRPANSLRGKRPPVGPNLIPPNLGEIASH